MNERLNTSDLAGLLSKQANLNARSAEKFIDAIADFVMKGIETNKSVKIIGFGVFKVVLVRERESVHIQTGERFMIPAHHKLSFIPDKELKENINKPFAFLEPVETADDYPFNRGIADIQDDEDDFVSSFENEEAEFVPEFAEEEPEESIISIVDETPEKEENTDIVTVESAEETKATEAPPATDYTEYEIKHEYYDYINPIVTIESDGEEIRHQVHSFPEPEEEYAELAEEIVVPQPVATEPPRFVHQEIDIQENKEISQESEPELELELAGAVTTPSSSKKLPLWLWFLLLPLLVIAGVGVGTYAFLHFNSNNGGFTSSGGGDMTAQVTDAPNYQMPLPLGVVPGDSTRTTDSVFTAVADTAQIITENTGNKTDTGKDEKRVIDWLATTPKTPKTEKEQPKRADKPNPEIERKNRELADKNKKAEDTKTTATTNTKTVPAQIRTRQGQTLMNIALEYYGDKVFWVYIYELNKSKIPDFNRIPLGVELRLPSTKTYDINPNSQSSVEKAFYKQRELRKNNSQSDASDEYVP
ncbi:MAG: HU family DNA-binding protein [Tannerella sp.]|jgi:nucleoid DNA-binding protein|nr:HU family DNA-binding protein [Tannerella sp.]